MISSLLALTVVWLLNFINCCMPLSIWKILGNSNNSWDWKFNIEPMVFLSKHKYLHDLITLASLDDTSTLDTLVEVNVKDKKDEGNLLDDPAFYRHLVGSLIHLTTTWPNISYAVHQVSQFMSSTRHLHLATIRYIICYLWESHTPRLFFPIGSSIQIFAYSDVD